MPFAATLVALIAGMVAEIWNPPPFRRWPVVTLTLAALVVATFALQSALPDLLSLLSRDPRMLASGEVWRAVTALFAQDGGTRGLLFNLFWLLVLGTTAERRFSRTGWLAVYFLGGILAEFIALAWQPHGAGSSIACLALAGALCGDWRKGRWRWWRAGVGLTGAVAASLLLLERDIHGIGFFAGLTIGFVLVAISAPARGRKVADKSNVVIFGNGTDTVH
jgi:membrane associated rhomboid family serine protease